MHLEIRGVNVELDDELKDHIDRRLGFALGRFAARIDRTTVRLSDVNGPRGGVDKRCRIAVTLVPRGTVRVEGAGEEPFALAASVARRAGRAVRRALGRRRRRAQRAENPYGPQGWVTTRQVVGRPGIPTTLARPDPMPVDATRRLRGVMARWDSSTVEADECLRDRRSRHEF